MVLTEVRAAHEQCIGSGHANHERDLGRPHVLVHMPRAKLTLHGRCRIADEVLRELTTAVRRVRIATNHLDIPMIGTVEGTQCIVRTLIVRCRLPKHANDKVLA